jgi:hypothetical protein
MHTAHRRRIVWTALVAGAAAAGVLLAQSAAYSDRVAFTAVPAANSKAPGVVAPDQLSPELREVAVAQGAHRLENGTAAIPYYGYDGDNPNLVPLPSDPTHEAHKTEPDKNTYLVFDGGLPGTDPGYDYGTHYLFQGHESGTPGYLTRINLDADAAHRVTLLATQDTDGHGLPDIDGSTWDPFAHRLLFTSEGSLGGGVWQADLGVPATVQSLTGIIGQGGYEGIQNDNKGNVYIVEDSGGVAGTAATHAKQPNSFIYRFLPADPADLSKGGVLQALQVTNGDHPVTFHAGQADADILGPDTLALRTYGASFATGWVTVHDTAVDGTAPFSANTAAKAAGATPFKRPENGQFRPDGKFGTFYFDETGDTDARTEAGSAGGGFGSVFKLEFGGKSGAGALSLLYRGDVMHAGFDNVTFLSRNVVAVVEDAGDLLHTQRNALDSGWLLDVTADYSHARQPARFLAQGRDASATIDSSSSALGNDGDNEITGIHASDGDPTPRGLLGAQSPNLFHNGWRLFYTRQHGDNVTFEIIPAQ